MGNYLSPFLKIASVGILKTLYFCASSPFSSTLILTKFTLPSDSADSSSRTGDTALHGPHHSAQKSTKTGLAEFRTSCSGQDMQKFAEIMWHKAAMAVMFEAKKDRIKSRLEKSFGPTLDKGADAVVEAISKKIKNSVQSSKTEQELRNKLSSILSEATN